LTKLSWEDPNPKRVRSRKPGFEIERKLVWFHSKDPIFIPNWSSFSLCSKRTEAKNRPTGMSSGSDWTGGRYWTRTKQSHLGKTNSENGYRVYALPIWPSVYNAAIYGGKLSAESWISMLWTCICKEHVE